MDADRFDALIRSLPRAGSRRRALIATLGGLLGLSGLDRLESSNLSAAKSCKGLKGKKKKKCLKKLKSSGCQQDADCPDKLDACQGGRCQRICSQGVCANDCNVCLIRYEADGDRRRQCADSPQIPGLLTECATDDDCPLTDPFCISFAEISCTAARCGLCATAIPPCDEPECQNDGDCPDQVESCQGGQCLPVCPDNACPGCNFCGVGYPSSGDRTRVCADTFTFTDTESCSTAADCSVGDICLRFPVTSCTQPPCGMCAFPVVGCT